MDIHSIGEGLKAQNPNKSNRKKVIGHVFDSIRKEDIHIRKLLAKQQKGSRRNVSFNNNKNNME